MSQRKQRGKLCNCKRAEDKKNKEIKWHDVQRRNGDGPMEKMTNLVKWLLKKDKKK